MQDGQNVMKHSVITSNVQYLGLSSLNLKKFTINSQQFLRRFCEHNNTSVLYKWYDYQVTEVTSMNDGVTCTELTLYWTVTGSVFSMCRVSSRRWRSASFCRFSHSRTACSTWFRMVLLADSATCRRLVSSESAVNSAHRTHYSREICDGQIQMRKCEESP